MKTVELKMLITFWNIYETNKIWKKYGIKFTQGYVNFSFYKKWTQFFGGCKNIHFRFGWVK